MEVTESGILTLERLQAAKELSPMEVTAFGMATLARPVQPRKVDWRMWVTESGIVTLASPRCNHERHGGRWR